MKLLTVAELMRICQERLIIVRGLSNPRLLSAELGTGAQDIARAGLGRHDAAALARLQGHAAPHEPQPHRLNRFAKVGVSERE